MRFPVFLLLLSAAALAQETPLVPPDAAPLASPDAALPAPEASASLDATFPVPDAALPLPELSTEPLPLLTPDIQTPPPPSTEKGTAGGLRQAIRIRQLTTQLVENDAQIQAQRRVADQARTPEGHRTALRNYYTLLYTKMQRLEPTLAQPIEAKLSAALRSLTPRKIAPSELLEPIPVLPGSSVTDHSAAPDDSFRLAKRKSARRTGR